MELAQYDPSGAYSYELAPTFLENLCTLAYYNVRSSLRFVSKISSN